MDLLLVWLSRTSIVLSTKYNRSVIADSFFVVFFSVVIFLYVVCFSVCIEHKFNYLVVSRCVMVMNPERGRNM